MERYLETAAEVLDQASPGKIFFTRKGLLTSERGVARKIIEHFAMRGFRRPAEPEEIDRLLQVFDRAKKEGKPFELRR